MIEILPFLKVAPVLFVALVSPGPDFVLVSSLSLGRGRKAGIQSAWGIALGIAFYVALTVWGLAALFTQIDGLMTVTKLAGGVYLCRLAYVLWKHSDSDTNAEQSKETIRPTTNPLWLGFVTNLTNPKALAFFTSIFALVLTSETNTPTKIVTTVLCAAMGGIWFSFVAYALSSKRLAPLYKHWRKSIDKASGVIIGMFGIALILNAVI